MKKENKVETPKQKPLFFTAERAQELRRNIAEYNHKCNKNDNDFLVKFFQ